MFWIATVLLSAPFVCMVVLVVISWAQGLRARLTGRVSPRRPLRGMGASYALGAAFLCFSVFYHPRLELATAAQVQQEEQDDEDDQGDPESPIRHLLRQLRRIRRGEAVDRLIWRLE
ncbi:MAG: hypothetical protein ACLGSD_11520 [Acidobacteriota bacterium]